MSRNDNIALIDLDGTVADHDTALLHDLMEIHAPEEPPIDLNKWRNKDLAPQYMFNRMQMIRSCSSWWENLPVIRSGMMVVDIMISLGFRIVVLTQGPKANPSAWKGKVKWVQKYMPGNTDMIVTRDKSIVYGKVLFDDYPEYLEGWLEHRPRSLAIMPAFPYNVYFKHPQVIRYENNLAEVIAALQRQIERKPYENIS